MKSKLMVMTLFLLMLTSTISADELVKGYYDPENDWFVFEYVSPEAGPQKAIYDPGNKVDPTVKTHVAWDKETSGYVYSFRVSNGNQAKQVLSTIIIEFDASLYGQVAPNADWDMNLHRINMPDTWEWFNPEGILLGKNQDGFSYKSKGLPSIMDMAFFGMRRIRFSGPSPTYDPDEIHDSFDRVMDALLAQYPHAEDTVKGKTLGPTAPPADFKPLDFLDYIISMKHEAFTLGWITNKGIEQSLDAKLDSAKKKLEKGDTKTAKNILGAFINEVEAQGCETYEGGSAPCPPGKHLTPEAYALLKYNVQYLIERL